MYRILHIPGLVFLATAFILNLLVSISVPSIDVVRVSFGRMDDPPEGLRQQHIKEQYIKELRLGVWTFCGYITDGSTICGQKRAGYQVEIVNPRDSAELAVVSYDWTRRLIIHPFATSFTLPALLLSLPTPPSTPRLTKLFKRAAPIATFVAASLTLAALAIDIAFFASVDSAISSFGDQDYETSASQGVWLSIAALVLTIVGGGAVFFARLPPPALRSRRIRLETPGMARFWIGLRGEEKRWESEEGKEGDLEVERLQVPKVPSESSLSIPKAEAGKII